MGKNDQPKPNPPRKRRRQRRPGGVPVTDRCLGCDLGVHHPGRKVEGCNCSVCAGGTG